MRKPSLLIPLSLGLAILLSACAAPDIETQPGQITSPPSPTTDPASLTTPTAATETQEPSSLAPQPLEVVFFSEDGIELQGRFFPAAALDRPVVVLMHWYPGDQFEWEEIAYWLQNRGITGTRSGVPWLDPSWFPTLPSGFSFNVLTFTFRGCQGGCQELLPQEWLRDALASLEAARSLEGVDPAQVVVIGASIGGDAAIESCAAVLKTDPGACLGALSLSPGNYLGGSYPDLVNQLEGTSPARPAWCLYDEFDPDAGVCQEASGALYYSEGWQGGNLHGMHLLTSTLDPLPLQRLLDFLDLVTDY